VNWGPHLRGHLLQFDRRPAPAVSATTGIRLLIGAVVLEVLCHGLPGMPLWVRLPLLLVLGLIAVRAAGLRFSEIGFRPWRAWTTTEKSYFIQVLLIANVVFPIALAGPIMARLPETGMASRLLTVFVPYLFFGFYQEVVYRGMVQSALERWLGAWAIVVANVLFTFGPLHWNYFFARQSLAVPMFASIFVMGLYFGAVYYRSRNLWMPAVFHAIGNAYMIWGAGPFD
jgi:membrane protease YdiL (CAAX protease family)